MLLEMRDGTYACELIQTHLLGNTLTRYTHMHGGTYGCEHALIALAPEDHCHVGAVA